MFSLADFEAHAKVALDRNAWDYYSSGGCQPGADAQGQRRGVCKVTAPESMMSTLDN